MRPSVTVAPSIDTIPEVDMMRRLLGALTLTAAASLASPWPAAAQPFTVEKFDIKGDGGTDYVAVDAGTGRVFVSRGTHRTPRRKAPPLTARDISSSTTRASTPSR